MSAQVTPTDEAIRDVEAYMDGLGQSARAAATVMRRTPTGPKKDRKSTRLNSSHQI